AINLMSANSAGGAAGQATDLLNDFKVGSAIGASPSRQAIGQCLGIVVGSLVGVLVYRLLIPDPQAMLITAEWPAPAVATWKAVAEALTGGIDSIAVDSRWAMLVGAVAGIALGTVEALLPVRKLRWWPSSAALGLAFIVPASISLVMGVGAVLAWLLGRWSRGVADRFAIVAAAGLVAGESITGVGASLAALLQHARARRGRAPAHRTVAVRAVPEECEIEVPAFAVPEQLQPAFEAKVRGGPAQREVLPARRTGLRPECSHRLVHVDVLRALAGIAGELLLASRQVGIERADRVDASGHDQQHGAAEADVAAEARQVGHEPEEEGIDREPGKAPDERAVTGLAI